MIFLLTYIFVSKFFSDTMYDVCSNHFANLSHRSFLDIYVKYVLTVAFDARIPFVENSK